MPHLLEVKDLTTVFTGDYGRTISVDHVSFHVDPGEVVCIVGESGCGKSVTSLSIMGLLGKGGAVVDGSVLFDTMETPPHQYSAADCGSDAKIASRCGTAKNLLSMSEKELDRIRGDELTMIFQDPLTSLNPVFTVGSQITESIRIHMHLPKEEARQRAIDLLAKVGMPDPENMLRKYPHTLSGGMRQRVMIAMALSCNPKLLIADEPTTALDVTIQAQIMNLLRDLQREKGMAMILITHDIGLVANTADRVLVMYAGQIIEEADAKELFAQPKHPYTQALLNTVPTILDDADRQLVAIPGMVPESYDGITGCRFADRCPYVCEKCSQPQGNYDFGGGHTARCIVAHENESVMRNKRSDACADHAAVHEDATAVSENSNTVCTEVAADQKKVKGDDTT
ncbi:MAG: ABC transporter ATP-binding protein [Lachnospiraceae bacterium]|nr:ABC transporter ATP-binding protein [Lachnospiraceae bacterium]